MKKFTLSLIGVLIIVLFGCEAIRNKSQDNIAIKETGENKFQLLVNEKPYIIKGVVYTPTPIGESHAYNVWADPLKPYLKDGQLMKKMGVNTIRVYGPGDDQEAFKKGIRILYDRYGIRIAVGHWLGFWDTPDYADDSVRESIKKDVLAMVEAYRNEKGILCWILGNENNRSFSYGAEALNVWNSPGLDELQDVLEIRKKRAEIYYGFVNEISKEIKKIDPNHPIVFGNAELKSVDEEVASTVTPDVDILGCSIYRGKSIGNFFRQCNISFKRPTLLIEFGCDRYDAYLNKEDQDAQADFLASQWKEIEKNTYKGNGCGNCLGGFVFEWTDEWWKYNEFDSKGWGIHNTEASWSNGSYYFDIKAPRNFNINEEWWGVLSLEKKQGSLDERKPAKAYFVLKELWKE